MNVQIVPSVTENEAWEPLTLSLENTLPSLLLVISNIGHIRKYLEAQQHHSEVRLQDKQRQLLRLKLGL